MDKRIKNLTGNIYGRLEVVNLTSRRSKWNETIWRCLCSCGRYTEVIGRSLTRGKTQSCGCFRDDVARELLTKHGLSETGAYGSWEAMNQRCNNPQNSNYVNYGGFGISICTRWEDFTNFFLDMGERPKGFSLDRYLLACNTSGKTGVRYREERGCWEARLRHKGKTHTIYNLASFEDAKRERENLEEIYCGKIRDYGKRNKTG